MPVCKKCSKSFPNRVVIHGKTRCLNRRKYCLTCSPFGRHNTVDLSKIGEVGKCKYCEKSFPYDRSKGHRRTICRPCIMAKRKYHLKHKAVEYKGGKCQKCGYDSCISALEFHHRDAAEKEFGIAMSYSLSWKKIRKELDKCDMLCANCHRELHETHGGIDWSK